MEFLLIIFKNIFQILNNFNFTTYFDENKPKITDVEFNFINISNILKKLPDTEGTSPDGISYRLLKKCYTTIPPTLTEIFRISLDSGKLPKIWKQSIVIPLFKKGDKSLPEIIGLYL